MMFDNCPLCGRPKGHAPGCPYGFAVTHAWPKSEPTRPYCARCAGHHVGAPCG
jgi:hypothetical protein